VNTICSQCGSVLANGEYICSFCDSTEVNLSQKVTSGTQTSDGNARASGEWRGELNERLEAYRAKRRKGTVNEAQSALPFGDDVPVVTHNVVVEVEDVASAPCAETSDDFAFTIAIGRVAQPKEDVDPRVLIDVSVPPSDSEEPATGADEATNPPVQSSLFPIASLDERRRALLIDAACLAFAYGGFLALFGSLGGQFTLTKLSAAVCFFTFAFVYLQYFGLFTVFGGNTPGMMVTGIQVASFSGDVPTPRQYMLRAAGYLLSAGTCFLGFLWVLWDEDGLTWHDRISNTYLAKIEPLREDKMSHSAVAR